MVLSDDELKELQVAYNNGYRYVGRDTKNNIAYLWIPAEKSNSYWRFARNEKTGKLEKIFPLKEIKKSFIEGGYHFIKEVNEPFLIEEILKDENE